ncbi:chalcone-flavanone isomerase-domain-containing protein [Talaromyces proteolyticus]|uniref:Chalcone-flavanone isomerase-domain-containing protein n=1 Tax=Talaromyces proteolyticus TaxID=1131652 RepID=A0AAD4KJY5_9EURO|nr:chalcone-flavanone isomerase-domain-containing protein [Talaromyces proteolyticus]KAH8692758.1 chalcone-flavanone isomerase-domain-containing protein [Talaromyces proteolyticus]
MPSGRKRRAEAQENNNDASDSGLVNDIPERNPQRRRHSDDEDDESVSDAADGDHRAPSSLDVMVKKMVRLAISSEFARLPIRRTDISAKVLGEQGSRQFKLVFDETQRVLRSRFGMQMVELPAKEKVTIHQRRAAQRVEKPSAASKSWIVISTLPSAFRAPDILPPSKAPSSFTESSYTALYTFLISIITLSGGSIQEQKLDRYLQRTNTDQYTPVDRTDRLLQRMCKEGYLVRNREMDGGEEVIEYMVGPRGKVEVGESGVSGLVRKVFGRQAPNDAAEDDIVDDSFEAKLARSVREEETMLVGGICEIVLEMTRMVITECLRHPQVLRSARPYQSSRSLSSSHAAPSTTNPLRSAQSKKAQTSQAQNEAISHYRRRMALSAAGIVVSAIGLYTTIKMNPFGLPKANKDENQEETDKSSPPINNGKIKLDGPAEFPSSPSVIRIQGQDGVEQVETGNSAVPLFPTTIKLPKSIDVPNLSPGQDLPIAPESEEEYQLLGFGIRTVSFLAIQVYVVGLYVAKSDIGALQQALVQTGVQPPGHLAQQGGTLAATSLVSTEREALKKLLLDPEQGEEAWTSILRESNIRTAVRIVPTRNTDFMHLRDAWVRHMTNRAQKEAARVKELIRAGEPNPRPSEFEDDQFGQSVSEFKTLLGGGSRKNIPKGQVLLLLRDQNGALDALFHPDPKQAIKWLGRVPDERVSRCVWLNYLAGKTVASDAARLSIVDGVMGIVERPVGTVVQKVI